MTHYLKALKKRSQYLANRLKTAYDILFDTQKGVLNKYNQECPYPQQEVDLFVNEWASCFPPPWNHLKAGEAALFEDPRIEWGIQQLGGVKNKKIIELGPLEGGHSYMLQQQGAASVVAIEANPRPYLRCLMIKQMMKLERVNFLFGDFNEYLRTSPQQFDTCIASGVLYHMKNPVDLIALIAQHCSEVFLWTHYYDPHICLKGRLRSKFLAPVVTETQGFKHTLLPYKYGAARSWSTFIGGPARTSCWLSRQDILDSLRYFGFSTIQISFEELNHPHGPSFALTAKKS